MKAGVLILLPGRQLTLSQQTAKITITGTDDAPTITSTAPAGAFASSIAEDMASVTGQLSIADADGGESTFKVQTDDAAPTYGTFSITDAGAWIYKLDNTDTTVQALGAGDTLTDTVSVEAYDGTKQAITVTINGTNDVPTIAVKTDTDDLTGSLTEDAAILKATGSLTITDKDTGEDKFDTAKDYTGTYGALTITADGDWEYTLDNTGSAVQGLKQDEVVTDVITVYALDGSATEDITITITGTDDDPTITSTAPGVCLHRRLPRIRRV